MKFVISLLFFSSIYYSSAQTTKMNQQWVQYYSQLAISKNWSILSDAGFRWQNSFQNKSLYIVRSGLAFKTKSSLRFAIGFAHLGFYAADTLYKFEFRPYQEIAFKKSYQFLKTEQRFRIEERIFDGIRASKVSPYNTFNLRFRYQLNLNFPLRKLNFKAANRSISVTVSNEIFLNAGNKALPLFDQYRFVIGPNYHFSEKLIVSLLYNAQFASTSHSKEHLLSSVAWLTIRHKIK